MLKQKRPEKNTHDFVRSFFESGNQLPALLTDILQEGLKNGYHKPELWKNIAALSSDTAVLRSWSEWASVNDREEIRLRLKVLSETGSMDESLVDFILFFFRASDPVLYQLSAIILGQQMENYQALKEYFVRYCKDRNISPDVPVHLNNQRSRRRVLLVLASKLASGNGAFEYPFPFGMDSFTDMSDADISILFLCCSIILEGGWPDCREYSSALIKHRFTIARPVRDRNLVRNAGILMTQLKQYGEHSGDLFHLCFEFVMDQYNRSRYFANRLQSLFLMDELMQSSVLLGLEFRGAGSGSSRQGRFSRFLEIRLLSWAISYQKKVEPFHDSEFSGRDSIVDILHQTNHHEEPEELYRVYADTIYRLSDEALWRTFTVEERSYRAFFLIDMSIHSWYLDSEEVSLLLESNGLIPRADKAYRSNRGNLSAKSILSPVLKHLLELEPSLTRYLFDPQLIHRLSDHALLPALIPTAADPDFLPILADAVEHQLRLQLAVNPSFHPDHYLYLLTIRRPSPRFYRNLLELCIGREYKRIDGSSYPLYSLLEDLLKQITTDEVKSNHSITPFWDGLRKFRNKLTEMSGESDLFTLLGRLENELHGTGAEQLREGITLHDLLEIVQPAGDLWYRAGEPSFTGQSGNQIIERDQQLVKAIKNKTNQLIPETLDSGFIAGEAVQSLEKLLEQLGESLLPILGEYEAKLFEKILQNTQFLLQEWGDAYSCASQIWEGRYKVEKNNPRDQLFEWLGETENPAVSKKLFGVIWETLEEECFQSGDSWLNRYNLLQWASMKGGKHYYNNHLSDSLNDRLAGLWKELALEAMDKKTEARVVQLLKAGEFEQIRRREDVRDLLGDIKRWCFIRYDYHHALQCNREINPSKNPLSGILKTTGEFTGHFAQVWVALLVGVIFMFDFGDPWTELAEIGDFAGVMFVFILGVAGTFFYVWFDLSKKTEHIKNDPFVWVSTLGRVGFFLMITFIYTALMVCLFWYMFSGTDQVVHGEYAPLHLLSWTGFALFVGVFLGLIGRD